jgi:hypothetical protein
MNFFAPMARYRSGELVGLGATRRPCPTGEPPSEPAPTLARLHNPTRALSRRSAAPSHAPPRRFAHGGCRPQFRDSSIAGAEPVD